mmetsp:Transcript_50829/g.62271  ORF Transcript_50829/g.62271 Transcript_50829/m.62271 type:complete len:296 (+) Transcript_50829:51-938(+)
MSQISIKNEENNNNRNNQGILDVWVKYITEFMKRDFLYKLLNDIENAANNGLIDFVKYTKVNVGLTDLNDIKFGLTKWIKSCCIKLLKRINKKEIGFYEFSGIYMAWWFNTEPQHTTSIIKHSLTKWQKVLFDASKSFDKSKQNIFVQMGLFRIFYGILSVVSSDMKNLLFTNKDFTEYIKLKFGISLNNLGNNNNVYFFDGYYIDTMKYLETRINYYKSIYNTQMIHDNTLQTINNPVSSISNNNNINIVNINDNNDVLLQAIIQPPLPSQTLIKNNDDTISEWKNESEMPHLE